MSGYLRFPTIHDDRVVFVAEDDLWSVSAAGGAARRLTTNLGPATRPRLSPDGAWLAFAGREEGPAEICCMPAEGGPARRLTHLGGCLPAGWSRDGERIFFASSAGQAFASQYRIFSVGRGGGHPRPVGLGQALTLTLGPGDAMAVGRGGLAAAYWKRYRGGRAGRLWVDAEGRGEFRPLIELDGNLGWPMWIGERIYFRSDHQGIGNLYSCSPRGEDLRRHTDHERFYARNPTTDGRRIVYQVAGDLWIHDPEHDRSRPLEVSIHSSRNQLNRRFVPGAKFVDYEAIHPRGHSLALTTRGKLHSFGGWEGAVVQHGEAQGVRYRLGQWSSEGERLVCISDQGGEESIEIRPAAGDAPARRIEDLDLGLATLLRAAPQGDLAVVANHRFELFLVDLEAGSHKRIDRSRHGRIGDAAWSPDGAWICYTFAISNRNVQLKLYHVESGRSHALTSSGFVDLSPSFDPEGRYLYFLSYREFNPVYDSHHFDLGFPHGARPFAIVLRKDAPSPFVPAPRPVGDERPGRAGAPGREASPPAEPPGPVATPIDLDGIDRRIVAFPVPERRYLQIRAAAGKALYTSLPVTGALPSEQHEKEPKGVLHSFDLEEQREETFASGVESFEVTPDGRALLYRTGSRLRLLPTQEKPPPDLPKRGRRSGWIDLDRLRVEVDPPSEWRQMFRESWRLMRENFWTADLSEVDWKEVYRRYLPLLDRVTTRHELSDLFWEVLGELGTSHAYEMEGDYRPTPDFDQGHLGADFEYDAAADGYRITHIVRGDPWRNRADSPLNRPGLNLSVGDLLVAIGGRRLSRELGPHQALVRTAGHEVALTFEDSEGRRRVAVEALRDERPARYREWVDTNRARVHRETEGRVGYVHVPDMGPQGFAEFHRYFLAETDKQALIIDARFNGGGHVSQLLLEKLARRPLGYSQPRWGEPSSYPSDSIPGPMVAITNEFAGSDGDIFSHCFKLMGLGPLIGKRTWGGVVGIWPRHTLVDGTLTTQPEFSFWFSDVGWQVEGYGTDPDIEVEIRPQDYAAGCDPQLERAIEEIGRLLKETEPRGPDLTQRPIRKAPALPPRM